jgi:hypothetical protein
LTRRSFMDPHKTDARVKTAHDDLGDICWQLSVVAASAIASSADRLSDRYK